MRKWVVFGRLVQLEYCAWRANIVSLLVWRRTDSAPKFRQLISMRNKLTI